MGNATRVPLPYASFNKRVGAFVLDLLVLGFVMLLTQFIIPYVAPLLVWIGYKTLFECSSIQATPGKRALDLLVVGPTGERISFGTSLLRTFVAWISLFTGFLVYFVALFTSRRQAIHDLVADTLVIEGRVADDSGKAWVEECKSIFDWVRSQFSSVRVPLREQEKLELIEKLNSLRQQGAITEEEYQKRKQELFC